MTQEKRFALSAVQKSDMWRRWKAGQSLHEIGRAFGKEHSSIRCLVSRYGGFVPPIRRRSLLALTLREREEISRGIASGSSIREIAKCLDRTVSTVSRLERKHQWAIATILPEENRPVRLYPVGSGQSSAALKPTPEKNPRFSDSCE